MSKNRLDIDKLIDKGWQQMSVTLDKQMPPKDNSGKKLLLTLILLLLIFVSGISYFYLKKSSFDHNENYSNQIQKVMMTNGENTLNKAPKPINISDENTIPASSEKTLKQYNKHTQKQKTIQNSNRKDQEKKHNKNNKNNKISSPVADNNTGRLLQENKLPLRYGTAMLQSENRAVSIAKPIVTIQGNVFDNADMSFMVFEPVVMATRRNVYNHSVYLSLNAISENGQSFGGGEFQVLYKYRFSSFMSLETGINFTAMMKYGMTNSFFKTYNLTDPIFNIKTEELDPRTYNKNFLSPVFLSKFIDDLYYVGIPVYVGFNYGKLEVLLGGKVKYMVAGTNYTVKRGRIGGFTYQIPLKSTFYDDDIYRKWDLSADMGINLAVNKHLSLLMELNYSFSGIIKSPDYSSGNALNNSGEILYRFNEANRYDKNVFGSIGVKYRLWSLH